MGGIFNVNIFCKYTNFIKNNCCKKVVNSIIFFYIKFEQHVGVSCLILDTALQNKDGVPYRKMADLCFLVGKKIFFKLIIIKWLIKSNKMILPNK